MKTLNLQQGSAEWLAVRGKYRTASEASAMMGVSPYKSRAELLREKATGDSPEIDAATQARFNRGHEAEALARPLAEAFVGEDLYPVTGVCDDDYLLASFDGLTLMEDIGWECKLWNEDKAAAVRAGRVPDADFWQVVHQLIVSGAERWLYTVSDGTPERTVHCWLLAEEVTEHRDTLYCSWRQFDADLSAYSPREAEPVVVGRAPEELPALRVEVTGMVTASNLEAFRDHALAVFAGINRELSTDADFADAEKTVKWCGEVEKRLEGAKEQALAQTADIDALFRTIDAVKEEARSVRLELDKLVKARKAAVRDEILRGGKSALAECLLELAGGFPAGVAMPSLSVDFAGAMKGKRTVASLRDAVDTELARVKVEAGRVAARIHAGVKVLYEEAEGYFPLFKDTQALVEKDPEDLRAVIRQRIAEFEAQQAAKAKAEMEHQQRMAEAAAARQAQADAAAAVPEPDATPFIEDSPRVSAAAPAPVGVTRGRPTYGDLCRLLAKNYGVSIDVAATWLRDLLAEQAA